MNVAVERAKARVTEHEKSVKALESIVEEALNMIYQNILSDEDVKIQIAIIHSAKESLISAKEELAWAKQSLDASG
jgi:molybdopterin biosynthesis enzyme MoaB